MAQGSYSVDTSDFPLVRVICLGEVSDEAFAAYLGQLSEILSRTQRYGAILDARRAGPPSLNQRRMQTEFQTANAPALRTYCAGVAFVMTSSLLRGVLNAIMWMAKPPFPFNVFATPTEAEAWLSPRLSQPG